MVSHSQVFDHAPPGHLFPNNPSRNPSLLLLKTPSPPARLRTKHGEPTPRAEIVGSSRRFTSPPVRLTPPEDDARQVCAKLSGLSDGAEPWDAKIGSVTGLALGQWQTVSSSCALIMRSSIALMLLASAGLIDALSHKNLHSQFLKRAAHTSLTLESRHLATGDNLIKRAGDSLTLDPSVIQVGSTLDGSEEVGANEANQALSATSNNNFINYCAGKTLTNGLQIVTGSCNGIPMGDIPAKTQMVSSIILFPEPASKNIQADTTFNITVQMSNLVAGFFTNADATYYAAPQTLQGGLVVGHTHVTVQDLGASLNPTTALDATQFAFFKGINDAGNGKGLLSAEVTGGLPAGNYRVCTIASASNHQSVLMPVAQRGSADDCTKFTVSGNGNTINVAANDGSGGEAAAALAASAVAAGPGAVESDSSDISSVATSSGSGAKAVKTTSEDTKTTSESAKSTEAGKGASVNTTTKAAVKFSSTASSKAVFTSFSNSTITKAGKGGKAIETTSAVVLTSSIASATSSSNTGSDSSSSSSSSGKHTKTITVIEIVTFFEFTQCIGGPPPPVSQSSGNFLVFTETFSSLPSAAAAACAQQHTTCISLAGEAFEITDCITQFNDCGSAASSATSAATSPASLTATMTVPASVTLSSISTLVPPVTVTVTTEISSSATDSASSGTGVGSDIGTSPDSESSSPAGSVSDSTGKGSDAEPSECAPVATVTVTVPPTVASGTGSAFVNVESGAPFGNGTVAR
ncbi:hypothetical protein B7494_g5339 [Chlorociboria aeruginascens]|nr:hypothetical protein B7494_g5339 [Chlorociboria aeruginascens]